MITPLVQEYLSAYLQGHRSADDTRQILRLIDDDQRNDGALEAEFDRTLSAVAKKIPGLAIDFEKLLASDEIECDPLISQGNLAILRLDAIFRQAFTAWTHSGGSLHTIKRITKPEDPTKYSERTEKHERTEETYPPDAQLINQIVNIALSGFRIQAAITHRRDQLKSGKSTPPVSRDATRSASPPQQSTAHSQITSPSTSDIIDHNEILDSDFDDLSKPIEGYMPLLIRGVNKFGILKGYDALEPLTKTQPVASAVPRESTTAPVAAPSPGAPGASARRHDSKSLPNNSPIPLFSEEEPVTLAHPHTSSPPTDHRPPITGRFPTDPAFHKRE